MSLITGYEAALHYGDLSTHRWVAPRGHSQATWNGKLETHLAKHRATGQGGALRRDLPDLGEHR